MKTLKNKHGITIKELKELIKDLPEEDDYGSQYEVWIEHTSKKCLSNTCKSIMKLNKGDIILSID